MDKKIDLCLNPSEYFHQCVSDVMVRQKLSTIKEAEFYLVDLLNRNLLATNLYDQTSQENKNETEPLAVLLMKSQGRDVDNQEKMRLLKRLGDTSLYISGFFGDSLSRKVVDLDYYREMGSIAYRTLSEASKEDAFQVIYQELCDKFTKFVDVLTEVSQSTMPQDNKSLLRLYEVYVRTGSELARKQLFERGLTTPAIGSSAKKLV